MITENIEMPNKMDFNEEKIKNTQSKEKKNTCLKSFNFTIKNSSKSLDNYYKITIENEIDFLSIIAQDKNDENQTYRKKYSLKDLKKLSHTTKINSENISEIYSYFQNLILLGNKAQITMDKSKEKEENISLIIKIINEKNKIVFNLVKIEGNSYSSEFEKKSLSEIEEHMQGSDLTKNFSPYETKDITNSESSKDKEKDIKSQKLKFLGKKKINDQSIDNIASENENCNFLINQNGVKNNESGYLGLVKDLYGNPKEKMARNNQSSDDDSNTNLIKENIKKKKINNDNDLISKEDTINEKNLEIDNKNQIIKTNIEINLNSNINHQNSSKDEDNNNIDNNTQKKKLIFSIQTEKYIPNIDLGQKHKFNNFVVIRNGMFPKSFLENYPQFERRRRRGEKIEEEEDEEEFKVYNIIKPEEQNIIRISTPMKLRAKTEYIDLSENDEDSPSNDLNSNSQKNKNDKLNYMVENDLLKSQIINKKDQIQLLIESLEKVNKNRNIEEEENESNTISKINLLYMASEDGSSSFMFHEKCDGKKNLLIIIHTDANVIFGGFTKKSFDSKKINKKADRNSFIFNLNKLKAYRGIVGRKDGNYIEPGILSQKKFGPCFLNEAIFTGKNLLGDIGHVGEKQCGYDTKYDFEINNGDKFFRAKEIEIYQVVFNDLIFLD